MSRDKITIIGPRPKMSAMQFIIIVCGLLLALGFSLLLTACSVIDEDTAGCQDAAATDRQQPLAIGFSTGVGDSTATTRAKGFIKDTGIDSSAGDVDIKDVGFGVFASYTGMHRYSAVTVKPDFMYNDHVYWDDGIPFTYKWTYSPLRYWPNGEGEVDSETDITGSVPHYVSFFAYAPYSDGDPTDAEDTDAEGLLTTKGAADYCISSFSKAHEEGDPWLVYRIIDQDNIARQVDLLYADGTDDQLLDLTKKPYVNSTVGVDRVNIPFKHALACFGEKVTITLDQKDDPDDDSEEPRAKEALLLFSGKTELRLTKVTIDYELTPKARLVLWNHGEPNWQPIVSEVMLEKRTVTLLDATGENAPNQPVTLFQSMLQDEKYVEDTNIANYDGDKFTWNSAGNTGLFFIPIEVDGFPQTATISVSYEVYVQGVKDEAMSATKSHTFLLSQYYDSFKKGGQRLDEIDVTLTLDNDDDDEDGD